MPMLGPAHLDALAYALDPPDGVQLSTVPPAASRPRTLRGVDPLVGIYRPAYAAPILRSAWNRGERAPSRALLELGGRTTPADQRRFADELTTALTTLAARYHQPDALQGRTFRVFACGYPAVPARSADTATGHEADMRHRDRRRKPPTVSSI